ncbi:uncharacterized protein [Spinacia oleracea]|uniref:Uncharacterized protein n=1 Tax=Spinacia oleracea TaxID=3562 RepID=A0ABM3RTD2_SPIOL|nr:uncharacterized protein LOC130472300 [Spinacia oleracea]
MAKFAVLFVLALLAITSGKGKGGDDGCDTYLAQSPGGCPSIEKCLHVCSTCFTNHGNIVADCAAPSGAFNYWECRCYFVNGAPCPAAPGPACPLPPPHWVRRNHTQP